MENFAYWKKLGKNASFDEVDTFPPEQRQLAGKVLIIGGNQGAFFAAAQAMNTAEKFGAGEVRVLLPESLKKQVPPVSQIYFAEAQSSGGFGRGALSEMLLQASWADIVILIGDLGKNAETSVVMADFMKHCEKSIFITRDAVDVVMMDAMNWSMRDGSTLLFLTLAQLQKLLRTLYYPKVITLSMPTNQLVETLHKFTLSYPLAIATFHNGQVIVAQDGELMSEGLEDVGLSPITLWGGDVVTQAAILSHWNQKAGLMKCFASGLNIKIER